jgi:HK97 family phage portal protein
MTIFQAFDRIESVNRGTNMIVSGASSFDYDIKEKKTGGVALGVRAKTLDILLNYRPNPHQSMKEFRDKLFTDFILEGNAFVYWDGVHMFHLPASSMVIEPDDKNYIKGFTYMNQIKLTTDEVFYFSDVGRKSIYRAESRLMSAQRSINILYKMQLFQEAFFENGAIPGLILETENTLSQQAKERTINNWKSKYNPKSGARSPMIVDNGLHLKEMFKISFQDMDFDQSIARHDKKILTALGVPNVLLEGGNNANISPNLRLFYLETILPIVNRYTSALERFFGFDIGPITVDVTALQPELRETSAYLTSLVNGGILAPNEARKELRYTQITDQDMDKIRVPANIAGSAVDPNVGGAPKKEKPTE